jgi:hypothetical protein
MLILLYSSADLETRYCGALSAPSAVVLDLLWRADHGSVCEIRVRLHQAEARLSAGEKYGSSLNPRIRIRRKSTVISEVESRIVEESKRSQDLVIS